MAVLSALSVTLEVPDIKPGVEFYTDAGLFATVEGNRARLRCEGQDRDTIALLGGAPRKRLHHLSLRADDLDRMTSTIEQAGGMIIGAPEGFTDDGLWCHDPHGMTIHLSDGPLDTEMEPAGAYHINAPGRLVRTRRSAMKPIGSYAAVKPRRLGHIMVFTPDVPRSVRFMTEGLGMGLADHAQDIVAFCCAKKDSDHHVVAFAKSPDVGFHHTSLQVADPDEVGRAGRALLTKAGRGDWGFGRHTIGSNFFHYVQDPWGSWLEYYSDMDHIDDYSLWTPTNYGMEDSMANWGPAVPHDFVHNYEADAAPYVAPRETVMAVG